MHGLLRSHGIHVSQARVAASLRCVAPIQYSARFHDTYRLLNPAPYNATHYGEKLHLDQNEKLVMYGVTHVVAVDGYSRKIVGFITIPIKNSIAIYDLLMRPLLVREGLWEQIRVDHGSEFTLVCTAQQLLANLRQSQQHRSVLQSMSRQNHRAERIWPEINQRINYPIKRILVEMESNGEIDMEDSITKFSVSAVVIMVTFIAIMEFISSWNSHRIPGRRGGIPNILARDTNRTTHLSPGQVPSPDTIVRLHQIQTGNTLAKVSRYGSDPLENYPHLQNLRYRYSSNCFPNMHQIFEGAVNSNPSLLKNAILLFNLLTRNFSSLV